MTIFDEHLHYGLWSVSKVLQVITFFNGLVRTANAETAKETLALYVRCISLLECEDEENEKVFAERGRHATFRGKYYLSLQRHAK